MNNDLENESIIQQLVDLAKEDGDLSNAEYEFLKRIATSIGIGEKRFDKIVKGAEIPFTPSPREDSRLIQLYRLILMMNVDLNATSEEEQTVRNLGTRLGLPALMTEALIDESKQGDTGQIPQERLIDIWRIHSN